MGWRGNREGDHWPVEVAAGKQALNLALSLEVNLSGFYSPTPGKGREGPTPISPFGADVGRQVEEARPAPAAGLA